MKDTANRLAYWMIGRHFHPNPENIMKITSKLPYCLTILVSSCLLVSLIGCGDVVDYGKGKAAQLTKQFKDATVLERMQGKLADAKKSRLKLKEIADKFYVDSEVTLKQIARIEEEKEKTVEAFGKLQDAAKSAGLPKFADATAEDKAKTLQVGTKNFTGDEVYRALREYKTQVEKVNTTVERERKRADFYKDRAEKLRSQMPRIDDNIAKMENDIADYVMYKELFEASKTLSDLGLSDDKMNELLNTDSTLAELRKEIDTLAVKVDVNDQENSVSDLKEEISRGSSPSITGDDLI